MLVGIALFGVFVLVVLTVLDSRIGDEGATDLPTATAPPTPGVEPPPVSPVPSEDPARSPRPRPQGQLAEWSSRMSDELGIPGSALEAYGYAESAMRWTDPNCGLSWSVLAGVGAVESGHGRYGGADLDETGRSHPPIRGIPLDGRDGVRLITDTDNGRLDGDRVFDRAVGPLQFIPNTWRQWSRDADRDGVADPNDLDDAALAAAHYLCDSGVDLRVADEFLEAVSRYNASGEYVQNVLDHADHYGSKSVRLTSGRSQADE